MAGITLQIPKEFQKHAEEAAAIKDATAAAMVTESVVATQEETKAAVEEIATAEVATVDKDVEEEPVQRSSAKAEKFESLAQKRVDKILEEIDRLTPLSNRRNYDYDEELVSQMFDIIRHELDKQQKLFSGIRTPRFQFRK